VSFLFALLCAYVYAILEHAGPYYVDMYMPCWNMLGLTVCCICHTGT